MVLDPIPQSLPVHFFGSRPQPPTSRLDGVVSFPTIYSFLQLFAAFCSVLQCFVVCCSVLQCVALQCVAVCCSVLQCVLQCVAVCLK